MKNGLLILNIVLLLAVGYLFVDKFTGDDKGSAASASSSVAADVPEIGKVAFISFDSIISNNDAYQAQVEKLREEAVNVEADLSERQRVLQLEAEAFQRNSSRMTQAQGQARQENLMKKRDNLVLRQQRAQQDFGLKQRRMDSTLLDNIGKFSTFYAKENGISVVLNSSLSNSVLFASDALDITSAVVKGLNDGGAPDMAADSTASQE